MHGGQRTTILASEYWCYDNDALWSEPEEQTVRRAVDELARTGLLGGAKVLAAHVVRVPRCYPVYVRGYREHVERIRAGCANFTG